MACDGRLRRCAGSDLRSPIRGRHPDLRVFWHALLSKLHSLQQRAVPAALARNEWTDPRIFLIMLSYNAITVSPAHCCANVSASQPRGGSRPLRYAAAALLTFLILSGCTREEATARLKDDIPVDTIDIIHARFPCRSPELHFFGYRFRIAVKGEFSEGEICWNFSSGQWSWRILPGQSLSRLNPRD
jgi:hypothetical protein